MEDRLLDKIAEPFNLQLPEYESMEQMIDNVLPAVKKFSEPSFDDETASLLRVEWVKMSDRPGDTVVSLYRFQEGGEIRIANDGALEAQAYEAEGKRIIIGDSIYRNSFLYELAFMDNDFLILKRHGNAANIKNKYLFFCRESIGTRLTWNEALEKMVDKYRNSQFPLLIVALIVTLLIAAMLYFR
jgi:hypothetical protein